MPDLDSAHLISYIRAKFGQLKYKAILAIY